MNENNVVVLEREVAELKYERDKLKAFKDWVHNYLDKKEVPKDPDPEGNVIHGCRISGRMNWVFSKLTAQSAMLLAIRQMVGLKIGDGISLLEYIEKNWKKTEEANAEHDMPLTKVKCITETEATIPDVTDVLFKRLADELVKGRGVIMDVGPERIQHWVIPINRLSEVLKIAFHNICHDLPVGCTAIEFRERCDKTYRELFGKEPPLPLNHSCIDDY